MPTKTIQLDPARIDRLRIQKGWALDTFARQAGVSNRTVNSVIAGKGVLVSTAKKLADALGVEIGAILAGSATEDDPTAPAPVDPSGPEFDVTFRIGIRRRDGSLGPKLFADFDETDGSVRFLDTLRNLLALTECALQDAAVTRNTITPTRGGGGPDHDWQDSTLVTVRLTSREFERVVEMDQMKDKRYLALEAEMMR